MFNNNTSKIKILSFFGVLFFLEFISSLSLLNVQNFTVNAQACEASCGYQPDQSYVPGCCSGGGCSSGYCCYVTVPAVGTCVPISSCFPAGTKVTLPNKSTKNIEDVKVGEKVLSDDGTGKQSVSTVLQTEQPVSNNICKISYTNNDSLRVTKGHPLYTQNGWKAIDTNYTKFEDPGVPVSTLNVGDFMKRDSGEWNQIANISCQDKTTQTYNLTVDNNSTFFADDYLVHNKGCQCGGGWNWSCSKSCPASAQQGDFCGWTKNPPIVAKIWCGTYSCNVCPSCNATSPVITGFVRGATYNTVTINWTPGNVVSGGTQYIHADRVLSNITSGCTGTCNINTSVGPSVSSYTANNLLAGSIYYWQIINANSSSCMAGSNVSAYMSSCTLLPASATIPLGTNSTFQNSIDASAVSAIANVSYTSSSPGSITVTSPDSNGTNGYTTTATAVAPGTSTITSTVNTTSYGALCSSTATATAIALNPWWQVLDSDITSMGDLSSKVVAGRYFDKKGTGNYPGIPSYAGATNLTTANVSLTGWLANDTPGNPKVFNYQYFANQIPSDTVIYNLPGNTLDQNAINANITPSYGYYWYKFDGSSSGLDLSTSGNISLGNKRVVLLVNSANFNIKGNINLTKGAGFFMVTVSKDTNGNKGNISVDPGVGGSGAANIEGIYEADSSFQTGHVAAGNDSQLWMRGSIVGYAGVALQRDLGGIGNSLNPAEFFEYAPDQILLFPSKLGFRKINWKEVAP